MSSKNFLIIVIIIIIGGGLIFWFSSETNVTSEEDSDEIVQLLNNLEQETAIDFGDDMKSVSFRWVVEIEPESKEVKVKGKKIEALGVLDEDYAKIESFLEDNGFTKDIYNITAGTVSGLTGYKKDQLVCAVLAGASGYKEATGQWIPPEPDKKDVEVGCGRLESAGEDQESDSQK